MNNLRKLRKEKGLTVRELGEKTNISFSTISAMENEVRGFTQGNMEILCKFFNVSADYLLGNSEVRNIQASYPSTPTTAKEQLSKHKIALYNQIDEISDEQAEDILQFIDFIKSKEQK